LCDAVKKITNILFLCTGNSARSIIAEGILIHKGVGRYAGFSAGSVPTGRPNPAALAVLIANGIDISFARSKSWDEFTLAKAPQIDMVITVCDNAANESCPIWPASPVLAHWGVPDPALVTGPGSAIDAAFAKTFAQMNKRINRLLALPDLEGAALKTALNEIGTLDDNE